jgi:putative FmdB family regulatory protein
MPIYEYRCADCGHELDVLQKISDSPLRKCPECGKSKLKRLMSAPSFRLKGSGWYETDFKRDSEKKRNLLETGDARAEKSDSAGEAAAKTSEAKNGAAEAKPAAAASGGTTEKKKPAAKKPAAAPSKKASTKTSRAASA